MMPTDQHTVSEHPPGASVGARRVSHALMRPLERFLHIQAASGIVLLIATAVALVWVNSPWQASYHALWATRIDLAVGPWAASTTLHFVVNDVLMAVFFFVIGLEVRRELQAGELSSLRRGTLPIAAALGGMVAPIAIYFLAGAFVDASAGWAVPLSTDTAFALGVLALLGRRIPATLRLLVLTIAVIDDVIAILVIAVFYTSGLEPTGILVAIAGIGVVVLFQRLGIRQVAAYVVPGSVVWVGVWWAGIHPTIAGVMLGLLTPATAWYGHHGFLDAARRDLATIAQRLKFIEAKHDLAQPMSALRLAQREAVSPLDRIVRALHPWAAFGIMPVFALANAGVDFGAVELGAAPRLAAGIAGGLVVGKLAGILLASLAVVKLRITALPPDVTWAGMAIAGAVAGIGFTMALFIAELAFADEPALQDIATVAVIVASAVAATVALLLG
ncbi:MAG: Na+/H+ antiporter NhaA, partial [Kofleriaceae bacterium]